MILENLGFALVLLLVVTWITSWSIFGAIAAGFFKKSPHLGALLGVTLGPLGLLAIATLPRIGLDDFAEPASSTIADTHRVTEETVDPFA